MRHGKQHLKHHFFRVPNSSEVPSWWIWPTAPWRWPFHWNPWMLCWAFVRMPWHPWKATWGTKTGEELGGIAGVKVDTNTESTSINFFYQLIPYTSYVYFYFFWCFSICFKRVPSVFILKNGVGHPERYLSRVSEKLPGLQSRLSAAEAEASDRENRCIDTSTADILYTMI